MFDRLVSSQVLPKFVASHAQDVSTEATLAEMTDVVKSGLHKYLSNESWLKELISDLTQAL